MGLLTAWYQCVWSFALPNFYASQWDIETHAKNLFIFTLCMYFCLLTLRKAQAATTVACRAKGGRPELLTERKGLAGRRLLP